MQAFCQVILLVCRPGKVYRSRPCCDQIVTHSSQRAQKVRRISHSTRTQSHSKGSRRTNGRRTAHLQTFNRQLHTFIIRASNPLYFLRQQCLVQKHQRPLLPAHCFYHNFSLQLKAAKFLHTACAATGGLYRLVIGHKGQNQLLHMLNALRHGIAHFLMRQRRR